MSDEIYVVHKKAKIEAKVTKVIKNSPHAFLELQLYKINDIKLPLYKTVKARVSFDGDEEVSLNNTVLAISTLKPFRSRKNEFGFDSERLAFRQHIYFKGRISAIGEIEYEAGSLQARFRKSVWSTFKDFQLGWLYYSLTTGDKSKIPSDTQKQIREMGLSHLLAISGLHVAIVFGWGYLLIKYTSFLFISLLKTHKYQSYNLQNYYCVLAGILTLLYVVLSGASVSAQRAFIMLAIAAASYIFCKHISLWRVLAIALIVVLLFDPFALLDPGLYFSFVAVATIFVILQKVSLKGVKYRRLIQLLVIQLGLFIFLAPITAFYFQGASISGVVINILVIPLLSLVIFPYIIIMGFLEVIAINVSWLYYIDYYLSVGLEGLYSWFEPYHWKTVNQPETAFVLAFYLSASLYLIESIRVFSILPILIASFYALSNFNAPQWRVDVFDVGHGTSVLITSSDKALLYDLGAKYFGRFSLFESVVLPAIKGRELTLSHTIISHLDNDHAGGKQELYNYNKFDSLAVFHQKNVEQPCEVKTVQMDLLKIESLWPLHGNLSKNNASCVVKVSGPAGSILLAGDVEHEAEKLLVAHYQSALKSDILLVPHHGSHTSSTESFIKTVNPSIGIVSRGYYSPWKLPNPLVKQRYIKNGVNLFDTALHGQITIYFSENGLSISTEREKQISWIKQRRLMLNDWNI